jgi:Holliday junction resolvase
MTINSRQKGARGEREWAQWLRDNLGIEARRGQQFAGGTDSPDVIGLEGTHCEVKRVEKLNISKAMEQAERDCGDNNLPYVAHRKNGEEWLITIRARDFLMFRDVII